MTRSGAGRADGVAQLIERPHLSGRGRGAARPARTSAQTSAEASARRRPPQNRSATIAASTRTRRAAVAADSSPRPRRRRFAGGEHQLAGLVVGQRAGLARRRRGLPGVLAGDAAQRVGDERHLRRVGPAGGAAGGGDRRGSAPDRGQLRPLGPLGEVGGDLRRRGGEGRGPPAPRTSARTAATARHRPAASPASGRRRRPRRLGRGRRRRGGRARRPGTAPGRATRLVNRIGGYRTPGAGALGRDRAALRFPHGTRPAVDEGGRPRAPAHRQPEPV